MPFTDPFVANPYPYAYAQFLPDTQEYDIPQALVAGTYTISWSGGGTLNIDFFNGTTYIATATGTSQIIFNLAQSATNYKMWNSVGGVSVVISLTALAVAPVSGTLYTFTTSQTLSLVGSAYCVLVGGGGGGGGSGAGSPCAGGGGGGINGARIVLTGADVLTIGAGGVGGISSANGTDGGTTSLLSLSATGGKGATTSTGGLGGTPNGAAGGNANSPTGTNGGSGSAASTFWSFFTQGSTCGGGGGSQITGNSSGGGSGIGTGGQGTAANGFDGTGYGAGGGGGTQGANSGNGTAGICYIVI